MIIQILNLAVVIAFHSEEMKELRNSQRISAKADARSLTRDSMEGFRQALDAVNAVIDGTMATAHSVLRQLGQTPSSEQHVGLFTVFSIASLTVCSR